MSVERKNISRPISRTQEKPAAKASETGKKDEPNTFRIRDWASI